MRHSPIVGLLIFAVNWSCIVNASSRHVTINAYKRSSCRWTQADMNYSTDRRRRWRIIAIGSTVSLFPAVSIWSPQPLIPAPWPLWDTKVSAQHLNGRIAIIWRLRQGIVVYQPIIDQDSDLSSLSGTAGFFLCWRRTGDIFASMMNDREVLSFYYTICCGHESCTESI